MIQDILDAPVYVQEFYQLLISRGESPQMAEILALRSPPRTMTDREFYEGRGTLEKQFRNDEMTLDFFVSEAKAHGYSPGANDVYCSELARFPGDPEAFVSEGRGQIKRVCEKRGWSCDGAVKVNGRGGQDEPQRTRLGKDIVQREVQGMRDQNPDLNKVSDRDLASEVISKQEYKE